MGTRITANMERRGEERRGKERKKRESEGNLRMMDGDENESRCMMIKMRASEEGEERRRRLQ